MRWLLVFLTIATAASAAAQSRPANTADEAAVRDVVRRYSQARELNDPKAIEALFTEGADQYTTSGDWRRGVPQLVKGMLATSASNPGRRTINIAAVRFITPDVAIVDGEYLTGNDARPLWTTIV
ncbi:MAG TPA: SgcJ/EcaC family oxidoreductase, partial [Vicinamibacterales bacterium]|nr:SgcJ/EcaC family oxidoreductase [Vicinamibacterales bacterium]